MRRFAIISVAIAIVSLFLGHVSDVGAERVLTSAQRKAITDSCETIQVELESLHSFDALMRVNLGQQYENILTSLMSPLNSRLALNQVDTVSLVTTSVEYTDALSEFRNQYSSYEGSLRSVIEMKCESDPAAFYTAVEKARETRQSLHDSVKTLNSRLLQYRKDYKAAKVDWEKSRG